MRLPVLKALSQRDFAVLWTGQTISLLGDGIFSVALAWQALQMPSGGAALALVLTVRSIGRVAILLLGGALADRYQKRLLMLGGDALQFVSVGLLAYLVARGDLQLWQLATVAGATGVGSGIFFSSSSALVPELVSEECLPSANSLRSSSLLLTSEFLGPALGGLLVAAAGTATAFTLDALSFLASIFALLLIRPRGSSHHRRSSNVFSDVRESASYVIRTPWIWVTLLAVGTIGNFASTGPLSVLIPLFVQDQLNGGAAVLGFVFSAYGVGGLVGSLVIGSRDIRTASAVPMYAGWTSAAVALGTLALAPNAIVAAVFLALSAFGGQIAEVIWVTLLQRLVPRHLLGRVVSTDWLVSLSLQPLGVALAAPVAGWLGVTGALMAGSALSTAAMAIGISRPAVRNLEQRAPAGQAAAGE